MVRINPFNWQRAICVNDLSESDANQNNKKPDGFLKGQRVICLLFFDYSRFLCFTLSLHLYYAKDKTPIFFENAKDKSIHVFGFAKDIQHGLPVTSIHHNHSPIEFHRSVLPIALHHLH